LEEQLASVGNTNFPKLVNVLTVLASIDPLLWVDCRYVPTILANEYPIIIRTFHESLLEKLEDSVTTKAFLFHLSNPETTIPRPSFCRLASEKYDGTTARARVTSPTRLAIPSDVKHLGRNLETIHTSGIIIYFFDLDILRTTVSMIH
jgi:hypothetical protein